MGRLIGSMFCAMMTISGIIAVVSIAKSGVNPAPQIVLVVVFFSLSIFFAVKYAKWKQNQGQDGKSYKVDSAKVINQDIESNLNLNSNMLIQGKKKMQIGCFVALGIVVLLIGSMLYAIQNRDEIGATQEGIIMNCADITKEQAIPIIEILKECGIPPLVSAEHDDLLDNAYDNNEKGYRLSCKGIDNIILYLTADGQTYCVRWADYDFYKEGNYIAKLTDYTMTTDEKTQVMTMSKEVTTGLLKAPSSAKFPSMTDWKFGKENGVVTVQSYVDAQNSFGANLRSEFQLIIGADGTITSLIFEGKECIL